MFPSAHTLSPKIETGAFDLGSTLESSPWQITITRGMHKTVAETKYKKAFTYDSAILNMEFIGGNFAFLIAES